jgi:hypothetical protein
MCDSDMWSPAAVLPASLPLHGTCARRAMCASPAAWGCLQQRLATAPAGRVVTRCPPSRPCRNKDPWKCWEWYGTEVPTKTAVRQLYNMTTKYLKAGGGPQYRVDGLFLWGVASWDLLGIHWRSYSGHGSYYETGVVRIVKEHNAEVNKGRKIPYSDQQMG